MFMTKRQRRKRTREFQDFLKEASQTYRVKLMDECGLSSMDLRRVECFRIWTEFEAKVLVKAEHLIKK